MSSIFKSNYVDLTYQHYAERGYVEKFCKHIFAGMQRGTLLDTGCGNAEITWRLHKLGFDTHAIDASAQGRGLLGDKLKIFDFQKMPYPHNDNTFDIVFCKSVIEHLREPDILVDEAYRMLKPGGIFICMTPSWKHAYKEQFYVDHTHVTPFTQYSLEMLCELSGFKDVKCTYFYQLPLLWKFPWLIVFVKLLNLLNLPYRPFCKNAIWNENINTIIRFSKEAMLLCISKKP